MTVPLFLRALCPLLPAVALAAEPPRELRYTRAPLADVLADVAQRFDIRLHPLWADGETPGLDPQAPISLTLPRPTLESALDSILRVADPTSTWQRTELGEYEAGPRPRLDAHPVIHLYDIADLLSPVPDFEDGATLDLAAALSGSQNAAVLRERESAPMRRAARSESADELIALIQETIEPQVWQAAGGPATIRPYKTQLVVRAAGYVHRQLLHQ